MTEKLYLETLDSGYYQHFDAVVTSIENNQVVLDRTLFYPLEGGQHLDTGSLTGPNGEINVTEVRGRNAVHHTV